MNFWRWILSPFVSHWHDWDNWKRVRFVREFPDMRFPVTYDELIRTGLRGSMVRDVVIDDADALLQMMFSWLKINMITMNYNEGVIFEKSPEDNPYLPKEYVERIKQFHEEMRKATYGEYKK